MTSESTREHRENAEDQEPLRIAVLTISDTRTEETDTSGQMITALLEEHGHFIAAYGILKDNPERIQHEVAAISQIEDIDVILTNGGTGISQRDGTIEAIYPLLTQEIPGFGELFRMLSWEEVKSASMLSRAIGGLIGKTLIFCMPGSSNAVSLAMHQLILPEVKHLVWETRK